jgi:alkylation response protein AidB-like acyl-CoA dehydrogenase
MSQTAQRFLADIRELAPHVAARATEIEAGRRIPPDLVETLRSIGVFRMFVPQTHGGLSSICRRRWRSSRHSAD